MEIAVSWNNGFSYLSPIPKFSNLNGKKREWNMGGGETIRSRAYFLKIGAEREEDGASRVDLFTSAG